MFRIGLGYDIHQLVEGRKLILAGIEIAHNKGLLGHSDADVVIHALIDALLGAMAKGDIGLYFPDNDMKYKDANSIELLKQVLTLMEEERYSINNIDINIIAQKPKLSKYREVMKEHLAMVLKTDPCNVNLKFKTNEELDAVGKELGIEAQAIVLLYRESQ